MAKLRAIFTVLVIVACVSISECRRVEDIKSQLCKELAAKVEKKLAEIESETIVEITENVCKKRTEAVSVSSPSESPVKQIFGGQCPLELKTTDQTCQEVVKYLYKPKPDIESLVGYLCREPQQVIAKTKDKPHGALERIKQFIWNAKPTIGQAAGEGY